MLTGSRSSVVDYLYCERGDNELPTFFFPRFDESISLSAETVLRSIIRQSLQLDDVTGEIERQLSKFEASDADIDTIQKLLQYCISRFSMLYIVIDASDEFEETERKVLLQSLKSIISLPDSKGKLFLVGRSSISTDIEGCFPDSQRTSADCCEAQPDIKAYIQEIITLRQAEELFQHEKLILQDPALGEEIVEALIDGADGMYVLTF